MRTKLTLSLGASPGQSMQLSLSKRTKVITESPSNRRSQSNSCHRLHKTPRGKSKKALGLPQD